MDVLTPPVSALKALADPLRWSIVTALAREELCVCHLTEDLGTPQPLVSHHLRVLREAGIVESEKWRYWTYYRLRPEALGELANLSRRLRRGPVGRRAATGLLLMRPDLPRRFVAEFVGTAMLVAVVVGSGIAAQRLSPGNVGLQLLENSAATAGRADRDHPRGRTGIRRPSQPGREPCRHASSAGSTAVRSPSTSPPRLPAESAARSSPTSCSRCRRSSGRPRRGRAAGSGWPRRSRPRGCCSSSSASCAPVAGRPHRSPSARYIGAAYWFTSSTSFANPAVTIARTFTDTFAGIAPSSMPAFVVFEIIGAASAPSSFGTCIPTCVRTAEDVIVPALESRRRRRTEPRARGTCISEHERRSSGSRDAR